MQPTRMYPLAQLRAVDEPAWKLVMNRKYAAASPHADALAQALAASLLSAPGLARDVLISGEHRRGLEWPDLTAGRGEPVVGPPVASRTADTGEDLVWNDHYDATGRCCKWSGLGTAAMAVRCPDGCPASIGETRGYLNFSLLVDPEPKDPESGDDYRQASGRHGGPCGSTEVAQIHQGSL